MSHEVGACPEALDVTDRNVCLNDAKVETYKNYAQFFGALREALIQSSPNDANALALDGTEVVWEKYRVTACDAMVKVYDLGTIKHPGSSEPSSQTRCLITITRSRMRDLKDLYAADAVLICVGPGWVLERLCCGAWSGYWMQLSAQLFECSKSGSARRLERFVGGAERRSNRVTRVIWISSLGC